MKIFLIKHIKYDLIHGMLMDPGIGFTLPIPMRRRSFSDNSFSESPKFGTILVCPTLHITQNLNSLN